MNKYLAAILMVLVIGGPAWGATYIVTPDGAGTSYTPAELAANTMNYAEGDTIQCIGTFTATSYTATMFDMPKSGTSGKLVVLDGSQATVSGLAPITGFAVVGGTVYSVALANETKWVLYNGNYLTDDSSDDNTPDLNEFEWSAGTLYINVGENPANGTVQICLLDEGVDWTGFDYGETRGFTISYTNLRSLDFRNASHHVIDNNRLSYNAGYAVRINNNGATETDFVITDNTIRDVASAWQIEDTTAVSMSGNDARQLLGIWDILAQPYACYVIDPGTTGITLDSETVIDWYGDCINNTGSDNMVVKNSFLWDCKDHIILGDAQGGKVFNCTLGIIKNIDGDALINIYDVDSDDANESDNYTIQNTIFYLEYNAAIDQKWIRNQEGGPTGTITNCDFWMKDDVGDDPIKWNPRGGEACNCRGDTNCTYAEWLVCNPASASPTDTLNADPQFVDAAAGDFRPKAELAGTWLDDVPRDGNNCRRYRFFKNSTTPGVEMGAYNQVGALGLDSHYRRHPDQCNYGIGDIDNRKLLE